MRKKWSNIRLRRLSAETFGELEDWFRRWQNLLSCSTVKLLPAWTQPSRKPQVNVGQCDKTGKRPRHWIFVKSPGLRRSVVKSPTTWWHDGTVGKSLKLHEGSQNTTKNDVHFHRVYIETVSNVRESIIHGGVYEMFHQPKVEENILLKDSFRYIRCDRPWCHPSCHLKILIASVMSEFPDASLQQLPAMGRGVPAGGSKRTAARLASAQDGPLYMVQYTNG